MKFYKIIEVLMARVFPGVINVYALTYISNILELSEYGSFSSALILCGLLSNLTYGIVNYTILPNYPYGEDDTTFIGKNYFITSMITLVMFFIMLLLNELTMYKEVIYLMFASFFGMYTIVTSILHARSEFIRYGIVSLSQSLILVLILYFFIGSDSKLYFSSDNSWAACLMAYAISYLLSFLLGFFMIGNYTLVLGRFVDIVGTFKVGMKLSVNNLMEGIFNYLFRFVLSLSGDDAVYGIYSYCMDLSQRTVAVIVNMCGFAITPGIYKSLKNKDRSHIYSILFGGTISITLSILFCFFIYIEDKYLIFSLLSQNSFDILVFSILCIYTVLNRLRKMSVDLILISHRKPLYISCYYLVSIFIFIPFLWLIANNGFIKYVYHTMAFSSIFMWFMAAFFYKRVVG